MSQEKAIRDCFISPNVPDSNRQYANTKGQHMKRRHQKRVSYSFQDLDRVVKESGLSARECSSTHWQIVLPDGQLNIWPTTSKGMLDIKGDRSPVDITSMDRVRNLVSGRRSEPVKPPEGLTVALRIATALERIADALEKEKVPY